MTNRVSSSSAPRVFPHTRWSVVLTATQGDSPESAEALESGYQCVIPLVEFEPPDEDEKSVGKSGVEPRVYLKPINGPLIKISPGEINHTNFIAGCGLAGTTEETLERLENLPLEP